MIPWIAILGSWCASPACVFEGTPKVDSADSGETGSDESAGDSGEEDSADDESESSSQTSTPSDSESSDPPGCGVIECDPGAQDCEDGLKCTPWRCGAVCCTNSTKCVPIAGNKGPGEACFRDVVIEEDNCAPGLYCMPDHGGSQTGPGKCEQLCAFEFDGPGNCADIGSPGRHCFSFNHGSFPACLDTCNPITQDCEGDGEACYLASNNFFCTIPTSPEGNNGDPGKEGETCLTEQGCARGLVCAKLGAELTFECGYASDGECQCARLCDTSAADPDEPCSEAFPSCEAIAKSGPPEIRHVGLCKREEDGPQ